MKNVNKKTVLFCVLLTLIGALLMVTCVFLPYATAIDDHAESIQKNPDRVVYEELDITAGDMMHVSMFEFANLYGKLGQEMFGSAAAGVLYIALVALIGGFGLLTVLFALCKKPIAVIIFDILVYGVFTLQNWDYTDRGVIPGSNYDWGMGYYLLYVGAAVTLAGAVWMLVIKIKNKKATKDAVNAEG